MSKEEYNLPDVNHLIAQKLKRFPPEIYELALKAIQLSEHNPEQSVIEQIEGHIREIARKNGSKS